MSKITMKTIIQHLTKFKRECILSPLFKALEAVFELLVPICLSKMIDVGISQHNQSLIIKYGIYLIILAFVGFACSIIAQYFAAKAAVGFSTEIRHHLFEHFENFSYSQIDTMGTSSMITRITADVNQTQSGVNMVLRLFLRSPFIVIGATIMAFTIAPRIAWIYVVLVFALFIVAYYIVRTNIPLLKTVQQKLDSIMSKIRDNLSGARVIRAFCRQDEQEEVFQRRNNNLLYAQKKAGRLSALLNPLTYIIINLFIVLLIYLSNFQFQNGTLSDGQIVALYNYMSQILIELIKFANLIITVNRAIASSKRLEEVFAITTEPKSANSPTQPQSDFAVEFDHVHLQYFENADEALTDITFNIKKGSIFGIIGTTGSGKSSVANLIPGFYHAYKGTVKLFGNNVLDYSESDRTSLIGIVPQKSILVQGTIGDNLRWGNETATDEDLLDAVKTACCEEVVQSHGGLNAEVKQGGRNFSGGQRQRLCIARALVRKPSILILDDSSSALDYLTDETLRKNIRKLSYHPTVIIISQRTVSLKDADQILVLNDGKMNGLGTHDELLINSEEYKAIYDSQGQVK